MPTTEFTVAFQRTNTGTVGSPNSLTNITSRIAFDQATSSRKIKGMKLWGYTIVFSDNSPNTNEVPPWIELQVESPSIRTSAVNVIQPPGATLASTVPDVSLQRKLLLPTVSLQLISMHDFSEPYVIYDGPAVNLYQMTVDLKIPDGNTGPTDKYGLLYAVLRFQLEYDDYITGTLYHNAYNWDPYSTNK